MILRRMAWGASTLLLLAGLSLAQTTAISGTVKGEDGKPLKDAVVKIERKDIKGNYKTKTNKKGEFYHGGLPLGTYDITLEVDGKDVDKATNVRTGLGDPRAVDFNLQEVKKRQEAMARAAETGQLTKEQERSMTPEQKAALEKANKERQAALAKNKALNDAFNTGMQALQSAQAAAPADKANLYTAAVDAFRKAGELDPNQHVVWAHLGDSYFGLAQTKTGPEQDQAVNSGIEAWQKALALAPNDAGYHNNFALALARAKRLKEAGEELQKAAQLDPTQAGKYYYNLGALLVNSGQNEPAAEWFKKAVDADPKYAEAHYQYGLALMGKAQTTADGKIVAPPGAKEEFEQYLQLAPNGPNAAAAKAMLETMGTQIETQYTNPNAPKKTRKK